MVFVVAESFVFFLLGGPDEFGACGEFAGGDECVDFACFVFIGDD